ncbi:hypothetical protein LTR08_008413 [Meristemomyces frigidus]|nr:hypothetical protein LTR08_008413 [Meristemomyces frigidus]
MAISTTQPTAAAPAHPHDILPGTTFPANGHEQVSPHAQSPPMSSPGPSVKGRPTTLTLFSPSQLALLPTLPSLVKLINTAFSISHHGSETIPATLDRLPSAEEYIRQLGTDPGTFAYVLAWSDSGEPLATGGAHRYVSTPWEASGGKASCFQRFRLPARAEGADVWELKLLAVGTGVQGCGVAGWIMGAVDEEVGRRTAEARARGSFALGADGSAVDGSSGVSAATGPKDGNGDGVRETEGQQPPVYVVLTTIKEIHEGFYARRGYVTDYETSHGPGFLGSPKGFHIVHMSKVLDTHGTAMSTTPSHGTVSSTPTHPTRPGTTFPVAGPAAATASAPTSEHPPITPGPLIHARPTTLTLFSPPQLAQFSHLSQLVALVNKAFSVSHAAHRVFPAHLDRVPSTADYLAEIGSAAGTFVYVLACAESGELLATAGAHRFAAAQLPDEAVGNSGDDIRREALEAAFGRASLPAGAEAEGAEVWELKFVAVGPGCQGAGVASWLMGRVDREVGRRVVCEAASSGRSFVAAAGGSRRIEDVEDGAVGAPRRPVFMVLTTLKEINEGFYARRGYGVDYETAHPAGFFASESAFGITHMSKVLDV